MIIYEIKNKINGKIYIGQHSSSELGSYWGSGKLIKQAIKKYGVENFERIILETCSTKEELNEREKHWIKEKNSMINGYNLTEGGTGGDTSQFIDYSEEWKIGQGNRTKQYWDSLSEVERISRSNKVSGKNNGMYGKVGHWKGKKKSEELICKSIENRRSYKGDNNPNWKGGVETTNCVKCGVEISLANKTNSCNTCRDRSGKNNSFFGQHHSLETRDKMRNARLGKKPTNMKKVKIDNVVYESLTDASRTLGISSVLIIYRIKSKNQKYDKYAYV